jgi:hypothetical protein
MALITAEDLDDAAKKAVKASASWGIKIRRPICVPPCSYNFGESNILKVENNIATTKVYCPSRFLFLLTHPCHWARKWWSYLWLW